MEGTSVIEISKSALQKNLRFIKEFIEDGVELSSVVKGNAYGHGIEQFVPIAQSCGINHFSTFSVDEAFRVFRLKEPGTRIMVMGFISPDEMEWVIKNDIEFFLFNLQTAYQAINIALKTGKPANIHIEIETGMNRTGIKRPELKKLVKLLKEHDELFNVKGLCTHYAGSESIANHVRVKKQFNNFNRSYKWLINQGIIPESRHTACSASAISYPKTQMDMVRIGILQYGFWPSRETFIQYIHKHHDKTDPLHRVMSWRSQVMTVKEVKSGEFISYGTTYLAQEDKTVAVVPVGYSHGYARSLSNSGRVLIHGQRVSVVGMVNMNMLIADVSGIEDVKIGDEVVLIGQQGDLVISVASFSELSQHINYESLVRLPVNTKRVTVN